MPLPGCYSGIPPRWETLQRIIQFMSTDRTRTGQEHAFIGKVWGWVKLEVGRFRPLSSSSLCEGLSSGWLIVGFVISMPWAAFCMVEIKCRASLLKLNASPRCEYPWDGVPGHSLGTQQS